MFYRYGHQVVLIMTNSKVGGLPIGVMILGNQSEITYTMGFKMLQDILNISPKCIMTDCSDAERNALHAVFPGNIYVNNTCVNLSNGQ